VRVAWTGCWFIVSSANQVQSASLIVRPGQCRMTSPTLNSSKYRP